MIACLGHTILVIDSIAIQADKLRPHPNLIHEEGGAHALT